MSYKIYKSYTLNVITGEEIIEYFTEEEWKDISRLMEEDTNKEE